MEEIAGRFAELKELLKKVSGTNNGYDQYKLLESYINNNILYFREGLFDENIFVHKQDWLEQLELGFIEPIYEVYRITIQDALSNKVRGTFGELLGNKNFKNDAISPLIAIYSQFSQQRISIYPFKDIITKSLVDKIKKEGNSYQTLKNLDDFLDDIVMSQAYYAISKVENFVDRFPFRFDRTDKVIDRKELFEKLCSLAELLDNDQSMEIDVPYISDLQKEYAKLTLRECVDFARSSLLTEHEHIYVYDLSFPDQVFAQKSMVLLLKDEGKNDVDSKKELWERITYEIDHTLSYVLAFEANLRTYDMFLRSSEFVYKKDEIKWKRIKEQIKFCTIVENIVLEKKYQKTIFSYNDQSLKASTKGSTVLEKLKEKKMLYSLSSLLPELQDSIDAVRHSSYRMPKYFSKSFRTLLLKEGVFNPNTAVDIYKKILKKVKSFFFNFEIVPPDSIEPDRYVEKRCIKKFNDRIRESRELAMFLSQRKEMLVKDEIAVESTVKSKKEFDNYRALKCFKKIFTGKYEKVNTIYDIVIKDTLIKHYKQAFGINLAEIVNDIKDKRSNLSINLKSFNNAINSDKTKELITPPKSDIRLIHGDLHFDNILIDPFDLNNPIDKLIDPGDFYTEGGDIAYDLGKLMHSFNGLYDFLHEGLYDISFEDGLDKETLTCSIKIIANEHTFEKPFNTGGSGADVVCYSPLYGGEIVNYLHIRSKNDEIIKNVFQDNGDDNYLHNLIVRAKFNEAMHFITMAPFHMSEDPKRSLAIYTTGLILMDIWLKQNGITRDVINEQKQINQ